jgi:hypothetical protein
MIGLSSRGEAIECGIDQATVWDDGIENEIVSDMI